MALKEDRPHAGPVSIAAVLLQQTTVASFNLWTVGGEVWRGMMATFCSRR
jgi:hypothetical protein